MTDHEEGYDGRNQSGATTNDANDNLYDGSEAAGRRGRSRSGRNDRMANTVYGWAIRGYGV